ncbi:MAG TPA: glycine/betaine ABC transporter ATP-binding protein, partial [Citreicella sp.]|nr:glycine/betaine ABC transporter ATP-binding protein [Citreicella sp.]
VMTAAPGADPAAPEVAPETPVRALMAQLQQARRLTVTDQGRTLGQITAESIVARLCR